MHNHSSENLRQYSKSLSFWLVFVVGIIMVWLALFQPMLSLILSVGLIIFFLIMMLFFGLDGIFSLRKAMPSLLIAAILLPYIRLPGSIPNVRPEFVIVFAAWGLLLLAHFTTGLPIRLKRCPPHKWFALFGLSIFMSMSYGAVVKTNLLTRDLFEFVKLILYFLIFSLAASQTINQTAFKRYYRLALVILMFSALVGFLQYIDFAGINESVSPYYAPTQMEGLLVHGRITGTTGNPNEFGALMVLAISLAMSGALFFRESKIRLLCCLALFVYGLALVLTMSRTSLVASFLSMAFVLTLYLKQRGFKHKWRQMATLMVFGIVVGYIILQVMPEKALFRYSQLANIRGASSWVARVENWQTHFAFWKDSPWFGWGPGKATMGTIVDNEWLLLLRRYGVIGLFVFLGLFGSLFLGLSRIRKATVEPSIVAFTVALQSTFVGYVLYMALASVYHSLQLMPIFMLFLGLAYSQYRPKKRIQEVSKQ